MIPDRSSFVIFLTSAVVLLAIPGPAVTYVVGRSIGLGRGAGVVSAGGKPLHRLALGLGARNRCWDVLSRSGGGTRSIRDSLIVRHCIWSREISRGGVLDLPWRAEASQGRIFRGDELSGGREIESRLRPGHRGQRLEPEDGAVLLRLHPAICECVSRAGGRTDSFSRFAFCGYGRGERQPLGGLCRHNR